MILHFALILLLVRGANELLPVEAIRAVITLMLFARPNDQARKFGVRGVGVGRLSSSIIDETCD